MNRYILMVVGMFVDVLLRTMLMYTIFGRLSRSWAYSTNGGVRILLREILFGSITVWFATAGILTAINYGLVYFGTIPVPFFEDSIATVITYELLQFVLLTSFLACRLPLPAHVSKGFFLGIIAGVNALFVVLHWIVFLLLT